MPLNTWFYAPHALPVAVLRRPRRAGHLRRPLVPAERQRRDDRHADHVDRLRQVGQHLLRAAGAEGRRGQGGPDGRAARACAGAPTSTSCRPRRRKAKGWGAFTLGVADTTPLEMANAYATLAADGRTASRSRCCRSPSPDGTPGHDDKRRARSPTPRCRQVVSPGRGPRRHRRGPLRHRLRRGRAAAAAAGPPPRGVYGHGRPARSPARPAPPTTPGPPGSSASPRSWPRRASWPTRTTRSTPPATATPRSRSRPSPTPSRTR